MLPEGEEFGMTRDMTAGLLALGVGMLYGASTFRIPVFEAGDPIGPRAFPFMVAVVVICCGAALVLKELRRTERAPFSWGLKSERGVWLRILLTIGGGILYGLVLDWLGYLIATFLFMIFVASFLNVRRHLQNVILAAAFSLVTFIGFAVILKLSLPRGILGGILPF
jgi:putative tricarboxylic transport membrane protein